MNRNQVEHLLEKAIKLFLKQDKYLLQINTNERSLTHKFAEYIQEIIGMNWDVDCEYNRYGTHSKKIIGEVKDIVGRTADTEDLTETTVYPDIIVHKRGSGGPNCIVIEAKKNPSLSGEHNDKEKLHIIKSTYDYKYAIFLRFDTKAKDIDWDFVD